MKGAEYAAGARDAVIPPGNNSSVHIGHFDWKKQVTEGFARLPNSNPYISHPLGSNQRRWGNRSNSKGKGKLAMAG